MVELKLESWGAIAPGLETHEDWSSWLKNPSPLDEKLGKVSLKQFPPMLRRRFSTLGKCAMGAVLPLLNDTDSMPSVFASRHGDTELTLSLLTEMGLEEPMSPTGFSLAVHNAVSGLFSIGRKDTQAVTSIAAMEGLVLQSLFEVAAQVPEEDRVLCVIYDIPLPHLYAEYCESDPFPFAIAMVFGRNGSTSLHLSTANTESVPVEKRLPANFDIDPLRLIRLLSGEVDVIELEANGVSWVVAKEQSA